jgi:mannosyltransferase
MTVMRSSRPGSSVPEEFDQPDRSWWPSAVAAVTLVGFAVRMNQIGANPLWLDEAFTLSFATDPSSMTADPSHPPGYYALLWVWNQISLDLTWNRTLSAVLSAAAIPFMAFTGHRIDGWVAGLLAALFLALSPLQVQHAQDVRMYGALMFCAAVLMWVLSHVLSREYLPSRVAYAYLAAATAALWAHGGGVMLVALVNLVVLVTWAHRWLRHGLVPGQVLGAWLGTTFSVLLLFAPWLPTYITRLFGPSAAFAPWDGWPSVWSAQSYLAVGYLPVWWVVVPWVALAVAGLILLRRTPWGPALAVMWLAAPVILIAMTLIGYPRFTARGVLWVAVPFYLAVAVAVARLRHPAGRVAVATVLAGSLVAGLTNYYEQGRTFEVSPNTSYEELAAHLTREAQPFDVVLFSPGFVIHSVDFHWRSQYDAVEQPRMLGLPWGDAAANVEEAVQGHPRVWVAYGSEFIDGSDPGRTVIVTLQELGAEELTVREFAHSEVHLLRLPPRVAEAAQVDVDSAES